MVQEFEGDALPLDSVGLQGALDQLQVQAADLWAILSVETRACGFLPDRCPAILFERHVFHKLTQGKFDRQAPDISAATPGGYGPTGAHQYDRLAVAIGLDSSAALESASCGIGQVMGFNSVSAGFGSIEAMVEAMRQSESSQLLSMANFIAANHWDGPLRSHDWTTFARQYNGPNYATNNYDRRLSASYQKYVFGGPPDLAVRASQVYLMYLELEPGPIQCEVGDCIE